YRDGSPSSEEKSKAKERGQAPEPRNGTLSALQFRIDVRPEDFLFEIRELFLEGEFGAAILAMSVGVRLVQITAYARHVVSGPRPAASTAPRGNSC
ncbi:MAG TPA: hypothetical protein VEU96_05035, partial [Bryobacteraceae bacterium]|nr:hypothetical protein [Bryobacteraceae bacterium]